MPCLVCLHANYLSFKGVNIVGGKCCIYWTGAFQRGYRYLPSTENIQFSGDIIQTQISDKLRRSLCLIRNHATRFRQRLYQNGISKEKVHRMGDDITPSPPPTRKLRATSTMIQCYPFHDGMDGNQYIRVKVKVVKGKVK